jgi:hypothetical protein
MLIFFGHDLPPDSLAPNLSFCLNHPQPPQTQQAPTEETPMREFIRPAAVALSVACLAASMAVVSPGTALAQAKQMAPAQAAPPPAQDMTVKQIALTEKQVEGVIAAAKDMDAITEKMPENAKPDAKMTAQLEGIAKKNGFASYDEYVNVVENIGMVLGGFDPVTKKYVGAETVIKAQIAQIQADKKMSAQDKKDALADLNDALKSPPPPIENKGNIDLVGKNYDKIVAVMGDDQQ